MAQPFDCVKGVGKIVSCGGVILKRFFHTQRSDMLPTVLGIDAVVDIDGDGGGRQTMGRYHQFCVEPLETVPWARVLLVDLLAMAGREVTLWMNFERIAANPGPAVVLSMVKGLIKVFRRGWGDCKF